MRILFDQGTPVPLSRYLAGHDVAISADLGWSSLRNGELLTVAEEAGYELLLTTDKNLRYQQNLRGPHLLNAAFGLEPQLVPIRDAHRVLLQTLHN